MATDKKYSITIGNLKETIKDVQSLGEALEKSGGNMSEYEKLTQKLIDYDKEYEKALRQVKSELSEKNKAVKEEVELEKANLTVQENVKNTYYDKQKVLSALGKQIKSMNTDTNEERARQQELIRQYQELNQELKSFDAEMGNHQRNVGDYRGALKEATSELKNLKGQMMGLDQHSKEFQELAKQAGETADRIGDINAAIKRNASDTKYIDSVIDVAKSATAAFGLWKGAMSAFGMETEAAEEAIQKLAAAMTIIQSLQTLSETLQSTTTTGRLFHKVLQMIGVESKTVATSEAMAATSTASLAAAEGTAATATKGLNLGLKSMKVALASLGIGLVIMLITTLVSHWEDLVGWFTKTFPQLKKLGEWFDSLRASIGGITDAVWAVLKSFGSLGDMMKAIFQGNWDDVVKIAKENIASITDAYKSGYADKVAEIEEEKTRKKAAEDNKQTKYELDMLKARLGNEAKYSKEGIELQKKDFEERRKMAKGNQEELNKINIEEANFYRECQENKAAAAKKSAEDRKRAEKEAADEAKRVAAEAEKKRKEAEKAAEEQRKKEIEAAKELSNARARGLELEAEHTESLVEERKRLLESSVEANNKDISSFQERIKTLQKIIQNENLSKKIRQKASEQLLAEEGKLKAVDEERISNLNKIADLEKEVVEIERRKDESGVINKLREQLDLTRLAEEEFKKMVAMSDEDLKKVYAFDDAQVQHVRNAAKEIETIVQKADTAIGKITDDTKGKTTPTEVPSGGEEKGKLGLDNGKAFWTEYSAAMQDTLFEGMDTISSFMDFAIQETERALEEVNELHEKALDKVNESADKIKELNESLKDSSNTNIDATKQQLADEQLLYSQRLAEEQKLVEKERQLKNKAAQQEASARKMELTTQMAMGAANTAQGVTKALATFAPPYSFILAASVGALGAVQTAMIARQMSKVKPIKYADGGLLQGPSHSQGGIRLGNIEVEGGEAVINKRSTKRFLPLLDAINAVGNGGKHTLADHRIRKYADGGQLNFQAVDENLRSQQQTSRLIGAINDIDFRPTVSVVDIARVQDRLVRVRGLSGR